MKVKLKYQEVTERTEQSLPITTTNYKWVKYRPINYTKLYCWSAGQLLGTYIAVQCT